MFQGDMVSYQYIQYILCPSNSANYKNPFSKTNQLFLRKRPNIPEMSQYSLIGIQEQDILVHT